MQKISTELEQIMGRLQAKASMSNSNETRSPGEKSSCPKCNDTEFIFSHKDEKTGYDIHKPCDCRERKAWGRRFKNAVIPEEFTQANFENYNRSYEMTETMYQLALQYIKSFPTDREELKKKGAYNFGFLAVVGEQRIRALNPNERMEIKHKHNNFGIGKTHLQIAIAKQLIKKGFTVLVISDVSFTDEMMAAKRLNDNSEVYNKLLNDALTADVLVWDDIGKAKPTEAKEALYYNIINERYKRRLPIIFNSNEDRATLGERIGYAANSRLLSKEGKILETEGVDYRLK